MAKKVFTKFRDCQGTAQIEWTIPEFLDLPQKCGRSLESPEIYLGSKNWWIKIYPNGENISSASNVDLLVATEEGLGNYSDNHIAFSLAMKTAGNYLLLEAEGNCGQENNKCYCFGVKTSVTRNKIRQSIEDSPTVVILFAARLLKNTKQGCEGYFGQVPKGLEKLSNDFEKLFLDCPSTDLQLVVQGRNFNAHKAVLISRSPVFSAMLQHGMSEKERGVVEINDLDPQYFQDFLRYIYSGKYNCVNPQNASELYKAAEKYDLQDLKEECAFRMKTNLSLETIFKTILLANIHEEKSLLDKATEFFVKNAKQIYESNEWEEFFVENPKVAKGLMLEVIKKTTDN